MPDMSQDFEVQEIKKRKILPTENGTGSLKRANYLNVKKQDYIKLEVGFDYSRLKKSSEPTVNIFGKEYKQFRVFEDIDVVPMGNFHEIIEASRDEDVDSDKDILDVGKSYCFRDLLPVKSALEKNDYSYLY